MRTFRKYLVSLASVAALSALGAGSANALPTSTCDNCIAYDFNYTDGSITNVAKIDLTDPSNIQQAGSFVGGTFVPNGPFAESGDLQLLLYQHAVPGPSGLCTTAVCATGTDLSIPTTGGNVIYATYDFTGSVDLLAGTVTFNPGGTISLFEDTTGPTTTASGRYVGNSTAIATFQLISGSAGITGGALGVTLSAEHFLMAQTSGTGVLTDLALQDLLGVSLELVTGDAHTAAYTSCGTTDLGVSGTTQCTSAETSARLFATVPEPASLGLLGGALVFFGFISRQRWRKQA